MNIFGLIALALGAILTGRLRAEHLVTGIFRRFGRLAREYRGLLIIDFRTYAAKWTAVLMPIFIALLFGMLAFAGWLYEGGWDAFADNNRGLLLTYGIFGISAGLLWAWQLQAWPHWLRQNGRIARHPRQVQNAAGQLVDNPFAGRRMVDRSRTRQSALHLTWSFGLIVTALLATGAWLAGIGIWQEQLGVFFIGMAEVFIALGILQSLASILAWAVRKGTDAVEFLANLGFPGIDILKQEVWEPRIRNFIPDIAVILGLFSSIMWGWIGKTGAVLVITFATVSLLTGWAFSRKGGNLEEEWLSYRFRRYLRYTLPVLVTLQTAWNLWSDDARKHVAEKQYTSFVELLFGERCLPVDPNWTGNLWTVLGCFGILIFVMMLMKLVVNKVMENAPSMLKSGVYLAFVGVVLVTLVPLLGNLAHLGYNAAGKTEMCSWFTPASNPEQETPSLTDADKQSSKAAKKERESKQEYWNGIDDNDPRWGIK